LVIALLLLSTPPATAEDEEPNIEFFYPVITRRPVIERELELNVRHEKGRGAGLQHSARFLSRPANTSPADDRSRALLRLRTS